MSPSEQSPHPPAAPATAPSTPHSAAPGVQADDVNAGLIALIGVFAAVTLFLLVVLLQAWFYSWKGDLTAANSVRPDDPQTALGQALAEQTQALGSYHWVNREQGTRAIPIDRAMELVARELAAEQAGGARSGALGGAKEAGHD